MIDKLTVLIRPTAAAHPLRGDYVEMFWTPIVGPSSMALLRHLARYPENVHIPIRSEQLGQSIGLNTPRLRHTLDRLAQFHLAEWQPDHPLLVIPTHVAGLSARHVDRLPAALASIHERVMAEAA